MSAFHLAQVNIALPLEPLDSRLLAGFVARLEPVNATAEISDGFVWRLQSERGDATDLRGFDDDRLVINLTVWESLEALRAFVYASGAHVEVLRRRREWFKRLRVNLVLWWVPIGHRPTVEEAEQRLALLLERGPSPAAFTFREHFPPPGDRAAEPTRDERELCPAG